MENSQLKSFLESLIFVSEHPLKIPEMLVAVHNYSEILAGAGIQPEVTENADATDIEPADMPATEGDSDAAGQLQALAEREAEKIGRSDLLQVLEELATEYQESAQRGIVLVEVANGWQFRTKPENAAILQQFYQPKPTKISKPSLETLAMVAYKQPITRAEIDSIRGVDSGGVLKTLLEKNLVRIVGKKDEPGKPMLYGTTQDFLELFQLKGLQELPTLKEFRELEEEFQRKASEGTVVENEADVEEDEEESLLESDSIHQIVAALDEEDEAAIIDLESSLKGLRDVEKEIFAEEKEEAPATQDSPPQS